VRRHCDTEFEAPPDSPSAAEDVWRPLDTSEALFATFNAAGAFLTAQVLEVHGPVTEALLSQAFAHLEKRHRVLRARMISGGGGLYWAEGAAISPRISIINHAPPGGLETLTEMELHRTYVATQERLWRCTWIPLSRDRHWIILALHHAVADGISSMIIARDLLATCSALAGVGELPHDLPAGPTLDEVLPPVTWLALLRHRARRLRSRLLGPQPILPIESSAPPEERRTGVIFGTVPGDLMLALQVGARSHHATINGVLAAALLESVRETLGPLPLVPVTHTVSMRGRAIPRNQVGCFVSNIVTRHPLRKRWSFWREAQSATEQLHRALDRGDAAAALLAARGKVAAASAAMRRAVDDPRTAGRIGALNIANRGVTSDLSAGPFRVAAWYPATSNHTFGNGIQVSCATVGQTFFFSFMYVVPLLSVASARRIADGFLECLVRVARNLPSDRLS
jgi:Condensation domain